MIYNNLTKRVFKIKQISQMIFLGLKIVKITLKINCTSAYNRNKNRNILGKMNLNKRVKLGCRIGKGLFIYSRDYSNQNLESMK